MRTGIMISARGLEARGVSKIDDDIPVVEQFLGEIHIRPRGMMLC